MKFLGGAWLIGLLTRFFTHEEHSRDSYSNLETSSETQGSSTSSDDSEASSLDTNDTLSSRNNSPVKGVCPSNTSDQSSSADNATRFRENAVWEISRSMASHQEKSYFEALNPKSSTHAVTNPSASCSNTGSLPVATTSKSSKTTYSNPKSSLKLGDKNLTSTRGPKRDYANDRRFNNEDSDPENPWTKVTSKKSKCRGTRPKNSRTKASSLESPRTTVNDTEKSNFKVTDPKSCSVDTQCLEVSDSLNSMALELTSSNNQSDMDSTTESSKLIVTSPKSSKVTNTTLEISNTGDSIEFETISSNEQAIEDDSEENSSNFITNSEKVTISTIPEVSSQDNYTSNGSTTENFDDSDSSTESSWITVTYSKNYKAKIASQKNSSLKGQNLQSSNNADTCKKSPAAVSYSKESKPKVTSQKKSGTTLLNLKDSTNTKNSRNAITNIPSNDGWTENKPRSGTILGNMPRVCKMTQNSSTSKTENLAHSYAKVAGLDQSRNLCGNLNSRGCQEDISVPSCGHGRARYSEVVKNSLSNTQPANMLNDTEVKNIATFEGTETSSVTSVIAETNKVGTVADDCLTNPPTIIISSPFYSPLTENNSPKASAEDMASISISTGNENPSTTSVNWSFYNSSQSMTSLDTLAGSSTGVKNSAISTDPKDETWQNLISGKNVWGNLASMPFARSNPDSDTPRCSPAKTRISPIGDERSNRSRNRAKSNQLPEQPSSSAWRPETESREENLGFSSLPSLKYSIFSHPSEEKWLDDSTSTSLVANNYCEEAIAVSSSSNPRAFLTEPQYESSSLMGHSKETEYLGNSNKNNDCVKTSSQQPLTSEIQSLNNCPPSNLSSKETSESLDEKITSHISKETNAHDSQECRSIISDLKSFSSTTSEDKNSNDRPPDTEDQQSTFEDPQARYIADNIHDRQTAGEDRQSRQTADEDRQSRQSVDEDSHGLDFEHRGSQDKVSVPGGIKAEGSPHGGSRGEGTVNTSPQDSQHVNVQNSNLQVHQIPHFVYTVPVYMYSGSVDPHPAYVNSPWPNYPVPSNTNIAYGNNAHTGLSSESYASLSPGGACPPPLNNTCQPSVSQTINKESVRTQSTFQQPTIANCSVFESQVTTGTHSGIAEGSQLLPYITINQPLASSSMAEASSYENLLVSEHNFHQSLDFNETNHSASGQYIPNLMIQGEESIPKQSDLAQSPYEQSICPMQFYSQSPGSFTDGHSLEPNQSSFGQPPNLSQSAYAQTLVRNQYPYSQPLKQNQTLCMPATIQSSYRQSLGSPHGQAPGQNRFQPHQNHTFYGQSANPMQSLHDQNQPHVHHSTVPTLSPYGQPPGHNPDSFTQLPVPIQLPEQNQQPSRPASVPIRSRFLQSFEPNQQPSRHTPVSTRSPFVQPPVQNLHPSIQSSCPIPAPTVQSPERNQQHFRQMPIPTTSPFAFSHEQNQQPPRQTHVRTRSPFRQPREQNQQPSRRMPVPNRPPCRQPRLRNQSFNGQTPEPIQSSYGQPRNPTLSPSRLTWAGWTTRQSSQRSSHRQPSPKWSSSS